MPPSQHIHLVDLCFWRNRHFPPGRHIPINYCKKNKTHHSYPGSTTLACYQVSLVFCTLFFTLLSYYSTSINCTSHTKLHAVYINTLFFYTFVLLQHTYQLHFSHKTTCCLSQHIICQFMYPVAYFRMQIAMHFTIHIINYFESNVF